MRNILWVFPNIKRGTPLKGIKIRYKGDISIKKGKKMVRIPLSKYKGYGKYYDRNREGYPIFLIR